MNGLPTTTGMHRALLVVSMTSYWSVSVYFTFVLSASKRNRYNCQFAITEVYNNLISHLLLRLFMLLLYSQSYLLFMFVVLSFQNCASLNYMKKCAYGDFNFRCQYQCYQDLSFYDFSCYVVFERCIKQESVVLIFC